MNMEKSTRYQAIGFIGSLFFVFNSCYLAYTIMYTYFMSDIQGFMERLFMVLSWLGLGVCLLLFVRGGALRFRRYRDEPKKRRAAAVLTALTVTAIGIAMVFGSLWVTRSSGGLIRDLTVTKKAGDSGGYYFEFETADPNEPGGKVYCTFPEYTLIEVGRAYASMSYTTHVASNTSFLRSMYTMDSLG